MNISLQNVGRRFNKEWIIKGVDFSFDSGQKYAISGPNGSGKSTLLSIVLGSLSPSTGEIIYKNGKDVHADEIYKHVSFAAPYLDLVEEFTLQETIDFHFKFKKYIDGFDSAAVLELLGLNKSQDKALKHFSSGMKQRTKLVLACCADTELLILDEPTSNLDEQGVIRYLALIEKFTAGRTVIVGSNQAHEYSFCNHQLNISDYKGF